MFNSCFLQYIAYARAIVAIKIDIVTASNELFRCRRGRQNQKNPKQDLYKTMQDLEEKVPKDLVLIFMHLCLLLNSNFIYFSSRAYFVLFLSSENVLK